jgi:hypothetical protein
VKGAAPWSSLVCLSCAACAVGLTSAPPALAEDGAPAAAASATPARKLYFYREVDYGSDSQFHPVQASIHVAFDILRSASYQDSPFEIAYGTAASNVVENLLHPFEAIEKNGGASEFIAHEVFPFKGFSPEYGQWLPNTTLHALGEGMLYRKLSSWYEAHGVPAPQLFGLLNVAAAQFINEVVENGDFTGANTDPVADFYIFNPLGYVLFSFDAVAEFFSTTVKLSYWPDQAVLDLPRGALIGVGSNYSFKVALPLTDWRFFFYTGADGLFGLSIPTSKTESLSLGLGTRMFTMKAEYSEAGGRTMIPDDLQLETGAFWDRDESLLASVIVAGPAHPRVAVNVYPGLLKFRGFEFGAYAAAGYYDGLSMGMTFAWSPLGLGFSAGQRTSQEWL